MNSCREQELTYVHFKELLYGGTSPLLFKLSIDANCCCSEMCRVLRKQLSQQTIGVGGHVKKGPGDTGLEDWEQRL